MSLSHPDTWQMLSQIIIGGVWVFHGFYSKILNGIPRHQLIVARILGERFARPATKLIGCGEVLLGVWAFTGLARLECATVQTLALVAMNALEIALARGLLISASGMVLLNIGFLAVVWRWALFVPKQPHEHKH